MSPDGSHAALIIVICGPAGSGKTTLCTRLLDEFPASLRRLVTTTSRPPRPGEVDGADYHFIGVDAFERKIRAGEFIEWARVHGRYYGSQKAHLLELLENGHDILLNIDIQGAQAFRGKEAHNASLRGRLHSVFIKPQSLDQIRSRLVGRGSDGPEEIEHRLRTAAREIEAAGDFDHVIISGTRDADYAALRSHYLALKEAARGAFILDPQPRTA